MNIISNSIKDISTQFKILDEILDGVNYVVPIESRVFSFIDDDMETTKSDLDLIFQGEKLIGSLERVDWIHVEKQVFHNLSYCDIYHGKPLADEGLNAVDFDEATKRSKLFWSIINKHVPLPPTKAYLYHPEDGCYFRVYVMWRFCFVLINEESKTGVFVYTAAWD